MVPGDISLSLSTCRLAWSRAVLTLTGVPRGRLEKLGFTVSVERQLSAPELSVDPCLPLGSLLVMVG